jgi:hypothetical protein
VKIANILRTRIGNLERANTPATGLVWVDDWESADELVSEMLANGKISSADEVTLVGWRGSDDQLPRLDRGTRSR